MMNVCLLVDTECVRERLSVCVCVWCLNEGLIVLTPDSSFHCESFCPRRLISALLLLMLLLLRRSGMLGRKSKREKDTERLREGEEEWVGGKGKCVPPLIGINTCLQQDINWHPVSQPLYFSTL